ncbi:MAG: Spx/MgsR family RNA polymerase-binding regulatory protein [Pigmentiphaga sp.]
MKLEVYGLKNCDTCRKARRWLDEMGMAATFHDLRETPPDAQQLDAWAQAAGGWEKLVNKSSTTWRALDASLKQPDSAEAWLALVQANPTLIKRPLLQTDKVVVQGFSAEKWKSLLSD